MKTTIQLTKELRDQLKQRYPGLTYNKAIEKLLSYGTVMDGIRKVVRTELRGYSLRAQEALDRVKHSVPQVQTSSAAEGLTRYSTEGGHSRL